MDTYNKAYQIVKEVLIDGEGHSVVELHEALNSFLGLKRSQSTSRIYRMVCEGRITNYKRGMYRLNTTVSQQLEGIKAINKTQWLFNTMKSLIGCAQFSGLDIFKLTDKDREALKTLGQIDSMIDAVLSSYREESESNQ